MGADRFQERPLGGVTNPDNATVGFGLIVNHFFGPTPLEYDYLFFNLGQGNLNGVSNQVLSVLNTGSHYANAPMCSITV